MAQQFFNRPPRIQPEIPHGELEIPSPPSRALNTGRFGLVTMALPLVTILGYSFVVSRGGNPLFILPMGLAAIATSIVGYFTWRNNQRNERQKQENYTQILENLRQKMVDAHEQQRRFYFHNAPAPEVAIAVAEETNIRLWERRPSDEDFAAARMGLGKLDSTVVFRPPSGEKTDAPQFPAALKLADEFRYVTDVPITLPLRKIHAVGVVVNNEGAATDLVRAMLVNLAAFHAPSDMRLYIVGTPETKPRWDWARWLPHTGASETDTSSEQLSFDTNDNRQFWERLQNDLERRQARIEAKEADATLPFLVVIVDDPDNASMEEANAQGPITTILNHGRLLGASVIFLSPSMALLPGECLAVVRVEETDEGAFFRYAEVGINSTRRDGVADRIDAHQAENRFARKLTSLKVRSTYGAELLSSLTMLDLYGAQTPDDLLILEHWAQSRDPRPSWPQAAIGMMTGNAVCSLLFEQNRGSGVHGLIAGTTGTGKSQLLMTLIMGLAIRYDPSVVNFVLVDYKGGTTFEALRDLPHTVDVITNLQGNAGVRAFTAIRAELNRRSAVLTEHRVQDIGEYHTKGAHLEQPLPHLFVIIDEFAEMIKERPEFKGQLDSIARLGRAVGMHLILSTQRPSGVVSDQIQANMKFRICLRVETADDSRELLGRADATFLPNNIPGRAYLRVGEELSLVQVAQVANTYSGPSIEDQPPITWLSRHKNNNLLTENEQGPSRTESLLEVIIRLMKQLILKNDIITLSKPWPDPLPESIPLSSLVPALESWIVEDAGDWSGINWSVQAMRATIGLVDDPINARQLPLELSLMRGHAIIFGSSGWGKTVLLRTIISALVSTHSPSDLHLYILDFGRRGLDVFEALPHLGAYITANEEERVNRLMRRLSNIVDERKLILSQAKVSDLAEYNERNPDNIQPAILLLIDNFAEFRENFSDVLDGFSALARDARAAGLHIVVTAEQMTSIPPKIYSMFGERLALRLSELVDYSGVIGRGVTDLPDVPGRGFIRLGRTPLEFQAAIMTPASQQDFGISVEQNESESLLALSQSMAISWIGDTPEPIELLPDRISLTDLLGEIQIDGVTLGRQDTDLANASVNLKSRGPHFAIVGPPLSGKTVALRTWLISLTTTFSPQAVGIILVDFQQRFFRYGGNRDLSDLPHILATVTDAVEMESVTQSISQHFAQRRELNTKTPDIWILIDNYDDILSELGMNRSLLTKLGDLAHRHRADGLHFIVGTSVDSVRRNDDFIKRIVSSRYGLALDAGDAVAALGGRARLGVASEMPPGRGFIVRSGMIALIQVATPQNVNQEIEQSLDEWVDRIASMYLEQATWLGE